MKKLLIIILSCFSAVMSNAETKSSFLGDNPIWCYEYMYFIMCPEQEDFENIKMDYMSSSVSYYFINGETTYEGKQYKVMNVLTVDAFENTGESLKIRRTIPVREENGMVFVPKSVMEEGLIDPGEKIRYPLSDNEYVIYDFTQEIGSTYSDYFVSSIDSFTLEDGTTSAIQNLSYVLYPHVIYKSNLYNTGVLGGVGNVGGLLNPFYFFTGLAPTTFTVSGNTLKWMSRDGVVKYKAPVNGDVVEKPETVTQSEAEKLINSFHLCPRHDEILEFIKNEQAGVESVKVDASDATTKQEGIFDVNGVRLSEPPVSGFYIENGEKKLAK